jgi:hypothetical protein
MGWMMSRGGLISNVINPVFLLPGLITLAAGNNTAVGIWVMSGHKKNCPAIGGTVFIYMNLNP